MKFARYILILIALLPLSAFGQYDSKSDRILAKFDGLFDSLNSLIFREEGAGNSFTDLYRMFRPTDTVTMTSQLDAALRARTAAEIAEGNAKTGLTFQGQAYWRLDNTLGIDDEDQSGFYRFKVQAEARWNFLSSGLFGREGRRKEAELKETIDRVHQRKVREDVSDYFLRDNLRNYYDSLMAGVLQHRLNSLGLILEAQAYLLENENVTGDALLPIMDEQLTARRKLTAIEGKYPLSTDLSHIDGYTIVLDTAKLMNHVRETMVDLELLELQAQLLDQQAANVNWYSTLNISPYARISYYGRDNLAKSTTNVDAGLAFIVPINNIAKKKRKHIETERDIILSQEAFLDARMSDKVNYVARELLRLNRESIAEGNRILEIKKYLAQRRNSYDSRYGQYNRFTRAREFNLYLLCMEHLIDFQYHRDNLLAELQSLVPDLPIVQFCVFTPLRSLLTEPASIISDAPKQ